MAGLRLIGGKWVTDHSVGSKLAYGFDLEWLGWLSAGRSVVALDAAAQGNITVEDSSVEDGVRVLILVSGVSAGENPSVLMRWTLDNGEIDERTIYFNAEQR